MTNYVHSLQELPPHYCEWL